MRLYTRSLLLLAVAFCLLASMVSAAPFDPVFRLFQVNGEVSVKLPGADSFKAAEEGKAYPYGTSILTGKRGAVLIVLAENNTCQVGPQANLTVAESMIDTSQKSIFLESGKLDVVLEEGNALTVATLCSSAESSGGAFSAELKPEAELKIAVYTCSGGQLGIMSDIFQVPALNPDDFLSVSCTPDQTFVRIKDIKGKFDIVFTDDTGTPRTVAMEQHSVVKIWRRKADTSEAIVVTILLVAPDGTLTDAVNYTIEPEAQVTQVAPPLEDDDDDDDDDEEVVPVAPSPVIVGDDDDDEEEEEEVDLWEDDEEIDDGTESSVTTTTSTMPDFTPTGLR